MNLNHYNGIVIVSILKIYKILSSTLTDPNYF